MATECARIDAVGSSVRPDALATGVWFWRATGAAGSSSVWQFRVGARETGRDVHWGDELDLDGNGQTDLAILGSSRASSTAYVYLGDGSDLPSTPNITLTHSPGLATIASAGDVNGDGFVDLAVGTNDSTVEIYFGSATGPSRAPDQVLSATDVGSGSLGSQITYAGDMNGDGYADLFLGNESAYVGADMAAGRGRVYLGSATGLASSPAMTIEGARPGAQLGHSASAADYDQDGYDDLAVLAAIQPTGRVDIFRGGAAGPSPVPWRSLAVGRYFSGHIADPCDVDGDGLVDIIVGAAFDEGFGSLNVFAGAPGGPASSPTLRILGSVLDGYFGQTIVAGDVDADGYWDVVVGAADPPVMSAVYLYRGTGSGLDASGGISLTPPAGTGPRFGRSMAVGGDANNDGRTDFAIASDTGPSTVYFYLGSASPTPRPMPDPGAGLTFGYSMAM